MRLLYALLVLSSAAFAHDPQPLVSAYTTTPPTLDGNLADWAQANFISVTPANGIFDTESATTDDAGWGDLVLSAPTAIDPVPYAEIKKQTKH